MKFRFVRAKDDSGGGIGDITATNPTPPSPQPQSPSFYPGEKSPFSAFRPSVAVVVGVLTTVFSVTFLLLLYAKHCKRGGRFGGNSNSRALQPSDARKNSGIERTVIDSLPIFRFGSLRGQKDGLECAVCLTRFEEAEVLRLLPKCKHAFHVECVDTWLDAHSTCPLCRYRVDPEDILLVDDTKKISHEHDRLPPPQEQEEDIESRRTGTESESNPGYRRVSGRHSSAGERGSGFLQIILQRPCESESRGGPSSSTRKSLDCSALKKGKEKGKEKEVTEAVTVGCFDRYRKDGLLLTEDKTISDHRFQHCIIISAGSEGGFHQRWSDVHPSDLLYLRSEMLISDSRRYSASGSRPSASSKSRQHSNHHKLPVQQQGGSECIDDNRSGRNVINTRSLSEITGLSRFSNRGGNYNNQEQQQQQQRQGHAGLVTRWKAWISQSQSDVRS